MSAPAGRRRIVIAETTVVVTRTTEYLPLANPDPSGVYRQVNQTPESVGYWRRLNDKEG